MVRVSLGRLNNVGKSRRPGGGASRNRFTMVVLLASLLFCVLILLADDHGLLRRSSFEATVTVRFDPDGHYQRLEERFGANGRFGSIETEREKALQHIGARREGDQETERLAIGRLADGAGLTFAARHSSERQARTLAETGARTFADERNARAARWLRERRSGAAEGEPSQVLDLVEASMQAAIDDFDRTSTKLNALSAGAVTFEDLATVDGGATAIQLLLERTVLESTSTAAADDWSDRAGLDSKIEHLEQQLNRELKRLASDAEDQAARLRDEVDSRPLPSAAVTGKVPRRSTAGTSADEQGEDIVTLLETAGPYAVPSAESEIARENAFSYRHIMIIAAISLFGAALFWPLIYDRGPSSKRPRQNRLGAEDGYGRRGPAWPLGRAHTAREGRSRRLSPKLGFFRPSDPSGQDNSRMKRV